MKAGMGKALRRAFRQDDILAKVAPRTVCASSQLMHPARMAIFSRSTFRPCSGLRQLARAASVSAPVAARHLARIETSGLVRGYMLGKSKAFVPLDMVAPGDVPAFALLGEDMPRSALRRVVLGASPNQRDVARKLRTYQQEAAVVLSKLVMEGLLEVRRRGREVRYSPSVRFVTMAEEYERRAPAFRERLMDALERDGIAPRQVGKRGCAVVVEADGGGGRSQVLFQLNPLCEMLR